MLTLKFRLNLLSLATFIFPVFLSDGQTEYDGFGIDDLIFNRFINTAYIQILSSEKSY